jgi:hypothetical protein
LDPVLFETFLADFNRTNPTGLGPTVAAILPMLINFESCNCLRLNEIDQHRKNCSNCRAKTSRIGAIEICEKGLEENWIQRANPSENANSINNIISSSRWRKLVTKESKIAANELIFLRKIAVNAERRIEDLRNNGSCIICSTLG